VSSWPTVGSPVIVGRAVFFGEPVEPTTAVAAERALVAPSAFTAVTLTRREWALSAVVTTYVFCVEPAMPTHDSPVLPQRSHWYWYAVGVLLHVPFWAMSVSPTDGVPVIVGGAVLTGAACTAASAPPTSAALTAASASARPARSVDRLATTSKPANFRVVVNNKYVPNSMLAPANETYITTPTGRLRVGVVWQNDLRNSGYYVIVAGVGTTDRLRCVSGTACLLVARKPLAHAEETGWNIKIVKTRGNVVLSDKTVCLVGK